MHQGLLATARRTFDSDASITPSVDDRTNSRPTALQRKRRHLDLTDDLSSCGQQRPRADVLLPTGSLGGGGGGGGGSDEEGRDDDDDHSGSDNRDETESSSSNDAAATAAQRRPNGGLGLAGCRTDTMAPAPRRRKRRRMDDMLEDWEKYDGVQSARAWEWDAGKEDFGEDLAEFNCAISSMQIACTAKESYPGGPKVCRIADLPYFGICIGEAFLQPGQALLQRLRLFFFFYRVIAGKVQVKLVSGDGERRQKAVSLFTATRGTVWVVPSGNTCRVSNGTDEPAAIAFTRVHGSVARSAAPGTAAAA